MASEHLKGLTARRVRRCQCSAGTPCGLPASTTTSSSAIRAGLAQKRSALFFGEQTIDVGCEHSDDRSIPHRKSKSVSSNNRDLGRTRPKDSQGSLTLIERDSPSREVSRERARSGADLHKRRRRHRTKQPMNLDRLRLDVSGRCFDSQPCPIRHGMIDRSCPLDRTTVVVLPRAWPLVGVFAIHRRSVWPSESTVTASASRASIY